MNIESQSPSPFVTLKLYTTNHYPTSVSCKNICERYPKLKPNYSQGQKYCRECEFYLVYQGRLCPCCHIQLRTTKCDKNRIFKNHRKPSKLVGQYN